MSKGAKTQKTEVRLPPAIEEAAKQNLGIANEVAAMGYVPYRGPTVPGLNPQQLAGMMGTNEAAQAFGLAHTPLPQPSGGPMSAYDLITALTGMQPPNASYGGFSGYSAAPMYDETIREIGPAHRAMIESFVLNPQTGAPPTNAAVPALQTRIIIDPQTGMPRVVPLQPPEEAQASAPVRPTQNEWWAEKLRRDREK